MDLMELRIKHQVVAAQSFDIDNPIGLILRAERLGYTDAQILQEFQQEKWFSRFEGAIRFVTTFAVSFASLFMIFNYQAYSTIVSSWVTATIYGEQALVETKTESNSLPYVGFKNDSHTGLVASVPLTVDPPDFRMELAGVFEGSIPVVESDPSLLDAKDWVNFEGQIQEDLRKGLVHYPYTALPGQVGNVFITGHSSYYPWDPGKYKSVFALLPSVKIGEIVKVDYSGKSYQYRITKKYEVNPNAVDVLKQPQDKKMLTLMTCTPIGTTLKRLIVEAELI